MRSFTILSVFAFAFTALSFVADFTEVCGNYYGENADYATVIKLYDDSTFSYTAKREFPFEVSEGTWTLHNDTVALTSIPCPNPEALEHVPVRTYRTFTNTKYFYKKNVLFPVIKGRTVKSEALTKGD